MATFYVNNVTGNDGNSGSIDWPYITIDKAIDVVVARNRGNDKIAIAYSGSDYTYNSSQSAITVGGYSWAEDDYMEVYGYDPSGGTNRPRLLCPDYSNAGYSLQFQSNTDYITIHDLYFYTAVGNISYNTAHIYFNSNIRDGDTHFKIYNCKFEGQRDATTGNHEIAVFFGGGTKAALEVYQCYFKNIENAIYSYTTTPWPVSLNVHNCISFNQGVAGYLVQFGLDDSTAVNVDLTLVHNTHIAHGAQYGTGGVFIRNGSFDPNDTLILRNNIVHNCNFPFYLGGNPTTSMLVDDTFVDQTAAGYNFFGYHNGSASNCIYNDASSRTTGFKKFAYLSGYLSPGDVKDNSAPSAYANWFVDASTENFFWYETGWMTIADLRPKYASFRGTFEDTTNGVKGALGWGGYTDVSIETECTCMISPYTVPIWATGACTKPKYLSDTSLSTGATFDFGSASDGTFTLIGAYPGYSLVTTFLGEVTTNVRWTGTVKKLGVTIPCKTRAVVYCPDPMDPEQSDTTATYSAWSASYTTASRSNTVAQTSWGLYTFYVEVDEQDIGTTGALYYAGTIYVEEP